MAMNTFRLSSGFPVAVRAAKVDPAALLRRAGLPLTFWSVGVTMVTTEQLFALFRGLAELSGEPTIGVRLPGMIALESLHPANLVAHHARTFGDGLTRFARYKSICCYEELVLKESKGECRVEFDWVKTQETPPDILLDTVFMTTLQLGRRGTQKPLRPLRVEFKREPTDRAIYEKAFDCPIKFRATRDAIYFRSDDLDLPFVTYNAELLEMLTPPLDKLLAQRRAQKSCGENVIWVIKRLLGGNNPDIDTVSRELGMSSRTLQRRINEEGKSFRSLLTTARQELAQSYLKEPSLGLNEISVLLSYEDPSSFFRAFQEWEGQTPGAWRLAHLDQTVLG
ncbi:MAG TPA: AraC family transcriptional regulator [Verrucomicrobiae bacterium]|jgi:AraC-like DNA-binding protein